MRGLPLKSSQAILTDPQGIRTTLEITEALLTCLPEVQSESKRHVGACEEFRKVIVKS
ncbi:MAG: hypothetical protein RI957_1744 [Verrucomicrobiota bacterium]|jgi:hypothetical protein